MSLAMVRVRSLLTHVFSLILTAGLAAACVGGSEEEGPDVDGDAGPIEGGPPPIDGGGPTIDGGGEHNDGGPSIDGGGEPNDGGGESGPPAPPTISDISAMDSPVAPGEQLQVEVTASGSGGTVTYDWTIPDGWEAEETSNAQITLTAPNERAVEDELTVEVSNEAGSDTASTRIATRGPVIEMFSLTSSEDEPWMPGVEVTLSVDASNVDGSALQYDYDIGGIWEPDRGAEWTWTVTQRAMTGVYQTQAIVEDENGLTATATEAFRVRGSSDWPAFGGSFRRTGRSRGADAAVDSDSVAAGTPSVQWSTGAALGPESSPVLGPDGTVYVVVSESGDSYNTQHLYAIDPNGGSPMLKWNYKIGNGLHNYGEFRPHLAIGPNGTVYISTRVNVTNDSQVRAIDPAADAGSRELWRYGLGSNNAQGPPAVGPDGTVYVGATNGRVYALDPDPEAHRDDTRDEVVWELDTPSTKRIWGLALANGTLYVAGEDGYVGALDPDPTVDAADRELWGHMLTETKEIANPDVTVPAGGPVYITGSVWYVDAEGTDHEYEEIRALDPSPDAADRELWRHRIAETPSWEHISPAIGSDGTVYVPSNDDALLALDPDPDATTRELWSHGLSTSFRDAAPALGSDGTIYIGSDTTLYALDPDPTIAETERELWRYETGSAVEFGPAIDTDGTVYAGAGDGTFYALH